MKIVIIVNQSLPPGLIANTTAVLGISLGQMEMGILGPDLVDASQVLHRGITKQNIPVLSSDSPGLKLIYEKAGQTKDISMIDFNTLAQKSRHYDEYQDKLAACPTQDLEFSGLCMAGPDKIINSITGSLGLYR